ncbi:MAG: hypothetical protein K1X56_12925 [Flavobacteriales bacterium]|nr:hypothetical protein [Flavobacteriales bacterium]
MKKLLLLSSFLVLGLGVSAQTADTTKNKNVKKERPVINKDTTKNTKITVNEEGIGRKKEKKNPPPNQTVTPNNNGGNNTSGNSTTGHDFLYIEKREF